MSDEATVPGAEVPAPDPNAGVTPAAQREVDTTASAPKDQRPGIASLFAEAKAAQDVADATPDEPVDDTPDTPDTPDVPVAVAPDAEAVKRLEAKSEEELKALADASPEALAALAEAEKAEPETPAGEDPVALKAELDAKIAEFTSVDVLNAALEAAGVDKISELPAVKALVGRIRQSAIDSTKAEIAKAQQEAAQLADVTAEGKAAKSKVINEINKLATDIENGIESVEEGLVIPTEESIAEAFEEYAGSAVGEYHTKAWNVLSESIYSLPEMGGVVPEGVRTQPPAFTAAQSALLEAVKQADPATWMAAHLAVERDVLWSWAQAEAEANEGATYANEKIVLQAAHQKELKALTKQHEEAIKGAREEARLEALADQSSGKLPPKTPNSTRPRTNETDPDDDGIPKGASIGEIRRIVKARGGVGAEV